MRTLVQARMVADIVRRRKYAGSANQTNSWSPIVEEEFDPRAWEWFLKLLQMRLGRDITHDHFRMQFEDIYHVRLAPESVSRAQRDVISRLFDVVARYSPFPHDRAAYPGIYRDEEDVEKAAEQARKELGVKVTD